MTQDEWRTARLLFAEELRTGAVAEADLQDRPEVRAAVRARSVPPLPARVVQAQSRRSGRLDPVRAAVEPAVRARRAVLGAAAQAAPRLLVRMDEYPHWRAQESPERYGDAAFAPWHEIMVGAGCAHLIAVVPRIADDPMRSHGVSRDLTDDEVTRLHRLADDGVEFGLHGYDHRTRYRHPRLHTEFGGRRRSALARLLRDALAALDTRAGIRPRVLVPPFNTFGARQYPLLSALFDVVTGGPEAILRIGYHAGPVWRGDAVYLPAYPPMYGTAKEILPAVQRQIDEGTGLWTPVVLHWGWEADRGWRDLERFAELVAPYATSWKVFLDAVEFSR
jgi:peptidoglycan/xylan/chitin deacetylase (PgdA/CDA1 family)